jgi:hypothetical protein
MAEPLSAARPSNISQATVIEFMMRYDEAEAAVSEAASVKSAAISVRKRLRKEIETAGITLEVFDIVRADLQKPQDQREREARERAQLMDFMAKPAGFQPAFDMQTEDPGLRKLNTAELKTIDSAGYAAGRAGHNRRDNPHTPGEEAFQLWDTAYVRAQTEMARALGPEGEGNGAADPAPRRGRGRPRKAPESVEEAGGEALH